MTITRIGLRASNDVSQSGCESESTTGDTCRKYKGCEKGLAVPGALPKAAARQITPIGLQSNRGGGTASSGLGHKDK